MFDSGTRATRSVPRRSDGRDGVWACRTIFNCTKACPVGIQVTRAIGEVKRALSWDGS